MNVENSKEKNLIWQVGLPWVLVTLFYAYQYILRTSFGWMEHELRTDFVLTAQQFGQMGAWSLYAYALLQIPVGFIVDRIGVKKTVLGSVVICLGGIYLFTISSTFSVALLSRILIGAGSACAFMCALKIVTDGMPIRLRGYFLGITLAVGTIVPMIISRPFISLAEHSGWRQALQMVGVLGLLLLVLIYFIAPKHDSRNTTLKNNSLKKEFYKDFWIIIKDSRIILYALLAIGLYTPLAALADLWGTAFFREKYLLTRADAAFASTTLYVGLGLGSIILPGLCTKENRLNRAIQICLIGLLLLFSIVLYGPVFDQFQLAFCLMAIGFLSGAEMMCFSGATMYSTPSNSGLTIGIVNTFNMLAGAILDQTIGVGLDFQWKGLMSEEGIRLYSKEQYVLALSVLIVVIGLCAIGSLFLKQKRQKQG